MDASKSTATGEGTITPEPAAPPASSTEQLARGSGDIAAQSERPERTEHSIMEGLPAAKAERVAAMRRELADVQRQLSEAQQRIAAELQARAEDDDRIEALEAQLQAAEQKAQQDAAYVTTLAAEVENRRALTSKLTTTADELRRDIVARDAQLEAARHQHAAVSQQLEAQRTSFEEAKSSHATQDAELATRTSERDAATTAIAKLEQDLADERKQRGALAEQVEAHAAVATERDNLKVELEKIRGELESGRAKARDVASQLARYGQELADGGILLPLRERPHPPPVPPPRPTASQPIVEPIIEVKAEPEPAPSRVGATLFMLLGGIVVGSIVTFLIVSNSSTASAQANHTDPTAATLSAPEPAQAAPQPEANAPVAAPAAVESHTAAPTAPAVETPPPITAPAETPPPITAPAQTTDGVLLLPDEASGHRLFVDGKNIEVTGSRATVPCGKHEIRIGSRGNPHTLDIACGGETSISTPL